MWEYSEKITVSRFRDYLIQFYSPRTHEIHKYRQILVAFRIKLLVYIDKQLANVYVTWIYYLTV